MARSRRGKGRSKKVNPEKSDFAKGCALARKHPLLRDILERSQLIGPDSYGEDPSSYLDRDGWAAVSGSGKIYVNSKRRGSPEEWAYVLAHCVLHLGLGHTAPRGSQDEWNAASCCVVARFLAATKIGRAPEEMCLPADLPTASEEELYHQFNESGIPPELARLGAAGAQCDVISKGEMSHYSWQGHSRSWPDVFARSLRAAVAGAIEDAAGHASESRKDTPGAQARSWFINHYPLLGSLATSFKIIEDPRVLEGMNISIGAVSPALSEIYIASHRLSPGELRFVMAHELLHVGLRHDARRQGRDAFLWNVACDYVINAWLIEMDVGEVPHLGLLHDPELKSMSAEEIYDRIARDLRKVRKLATLRGVGLGDIIEDRPSWWGSVEGLRLDEFYRSCLAQGLDYHQQAGRGLVPAGLVEEIRALLTPAIAWDVQLAHWFDERFAPLAKRRSYARPSRRQSSTPDIPRASWYLRHEDKRHRTFGVVLDSSGSMDRDLLARALGSIAGFAIARDVPAARVVFCDAQAYDQGYMPVEDIANRPVKVRGRGGTILQPAIDLLRKAKDFPEGGPILIISDGYCDHLRVTGDHAYLIPAGNSLPFRPSGPVFRVQ